MATMFQQIVSDSIATLDAIRALETELNAATELICQSLKDGHKLLACGNGGSAADASHLVTEFVVRFLKDRRPYPGICLSDSGSTLTAAGNDYGFEHVFSRQVRALGRPGDVLVVFTTSGNSPNIIHALKQAETIGVQTIAMLGKDGGDAKGLANIELLVPSRNTARIQEAHHLFIHALCEMVESSLNNDST